MSLFEARILKKWFRPLRRGLVLGLLSGVSGALAQGVLCGTPGKDDVGTGLTGVVNTYYPGNANASAGATSISVGIATGASTAITTGDLLLVIQMQDAVLNTSNTTAYGNGTTTASGATSISAGKYEYVVAKSAISGNSVTVAGTGTGGGLLNSYSASAYSGASAQKTFQVIRVPQYSSVTLGGTLTAPAWNGKTGGIVAIDVSGTLSMGSGGIDVSGLGFRGGAGRSLSGIGATATTATKTDFRNLSGLAVHAQKGEGLAGTPRYVNNGGTALVDTGVEGYPDGSTAQGAPGNAGGGGTDGQVSANDRNSGGGGGANGGVGGRGGNTWSGNDVTGGYGGSSITASATNLFMGGGGGAGTTNNGSGALANGFSASGAAGGGMVFVRAGAVSGSGSINANGAAANNTVTNDGSGGGGAGGSVLVVAQSALPSGLTINAKGGSGGTNTGGGAPHGPGGGGGGGVVALSSAGPVITVVGGVNGTTAGTPAAFGATSGLNGQTLTIVGSDVPGVRSTALCVALPTLTVSKISNGGIGTFSFSGSNGFSSQNITTVTDGKAHAGTKQTLSAASTATTITETPATGYTLISATCSGMGSGGTATLSGNVLTLNAAATAVGSNITCTFVNNKPPSITLLKLGRNISVSPAQPFIGSAGSIGVKPGETVEYCIVYSNTGGAASNFILQDYVPVGMVAQRSAYGTSGAGEPLGLKYKAGVALAVGNANSSAVTPALTSASDTDAGSLTNTNTTKPGQPTPVYPGVMTLNLGAAGVAAGTTATPAVGTVCFQTKVP